MPRAQSKWMDWAAENGASYNNRFKLFVGEYSGS